MKNRRNLSRTFTWIVFIMLIIALLYSTAGIIITSLHRSVGVLLARHPEEYIKICLQSILGITIIYLPDLLKKRLGMTFTDGMQIIYVLFLWGAIILGETFNFYRRFPGWDTLLHTLSGVMVGAFGFSIVDMLNDNKSIWMKLSPLFVSFYAFCIAVTLGVCWELLEFSMDLLMNLNMQQYATYEGVILIGKDALFDTMKDLTVDVLGAIVICIVGYWMIRSRRKDDPESDAITIG